MEPKLIQRIREAVDRGVRTAGIESILEEVRTAERERHRPALEAALDSLESLRRGHGVEVSALCYPAVNLVRDALANASWSARTDSSASLVADKSTARMGTTGER